MSESQTPIDGGCGRSIHSSGRIAESSNSYTALEGLKISSVGGKKNHVAICLCQAFPAVLRL
jgi:hypothetical protein